MKKPLETKLAKELQECIRVLRDEGFGEDVVLASVFMKMGCSTFRVESEVRKILQPASSAN